MAPFFHVLDALPYVCLARCGKPAVFVWLCKLRTIEDHVLDHATVVSSTSIFKAKESPHLQLTLLESLFNVNTHPVCVR